MKRSLLFKFDKNLPYVEPINDPMAVCTPLNLHNNENAIPMNCSQVWKQEDYLNNRFYQIPAAADTDFIEKILDRDGNIIFDNELLQAEGVNLEIREKQ